MVDELKKSSVFSGSAVRLSRIYRREDRYNMSHPESCGMAHSYGCASYFFLDNSTSQATMHKVSKCVQYAQNA